MRPSAGIQPLTNTYLEMGTANVEIGPPTPAVSLEKRNDSARLGSQVQGIDIGVLFNNLSAGGGARIQSALFYGPFTATLTALDGLGNVIGTTVMAGNSTPAG